MKLVTLILLLPFLVKAQDHRTDLKVALQTIAAQKNYSMRVYYRLYLDDNLKKPFQESAVDLKKNETGMFYKYDNGLEVMCNNSYEIALDPATLKMTAQRKTIQTNTSVQNLLGETQRELENMISKSEKVETLSSSTNRIVYKLMLKQGQPLEYMIAHIDKQKHVLIKVQYKYREAIPVSELQNTKHTALFEIAYENLDLKTVLNPALFDEKKYLVLQNGKMAPTQKYKGYNLLILN